MNTPLKDPSLKIRYAMGLGDFVASVLHSKLLSWLTKLITGKDRPCELCSKRAQALNILFPIPFWRLFFRTNESMMDSYRKELEAFGYKVKVSPDGKAISGVKAEVVQNVPEQVPNRIFPELTPYSKEEEILNNYDLINNYDTKSGDFLIRTQIFKSK